MRAVRVCVRECKGGRANESWCGARTRACASTSAFDCFVRCDSAPPSWVVMVMVDMGVWLPGTRGVYERPVGRSYRCTRPTPPGLTGLLSFFVQLYCTPPVKCCPELCLEPQLCTCACIARDVVPCTVE